MTYAERCSGKYGHRNRETEAETEEEIKHHIWIYLQSKCFFFGAIISSVVALHTDLARPWPAKLCRAANRRSFIVCPAIIFAPFLLYIHFSVCMCIENDSQIHLRIRNFMGFFTVVGLSFCYICFFTKYFCCFVVFFSFKITFGWFSLLH